MFKNNFDKDNYIPNMADAIHANELLINNVEDNALNKLFIVYVFYRFSKNRTD